MDRLPRGRFLVAPVILPKKVAEAERKRYTAMAAVQRKDVGVAEAPLENDVEIVEAQTGHTLKIISTSWRNQSPALGV